MPSRTRGGLSAVSEDSGRVRWTQATSGLHRPVLLETGELVTTSVDGSVLWINNEDGELLGELKLQASGLSRPIPWGDHVLLHNAQTGLQVIDQNTQRLIGSFDPGSGIDGEPAFAGNRVFVLTNRGYVYALAAFRR